MKTEQQKFDEYQAAAFHAHHANYSKREPNFKACELIWTLGQLKEKTVQLLGSKNSNYLNR